MATEWTHLVTYSKWKFANQIECERYAILIKVTNGKATRFAMVSRNS